MTIAFKGLLRGSRLIASLTLLGVAVILATPGFGQAISGNVVGTVYDSSGGGVPSATVTAKNVGTSVSYRTTANGQGEYRIENLPPAEYDITATATGFTGSTIKTVPIQLNQSATANFTLQPGTVSTTVEVTSAGAIIDTTSVQIQNSYGIRQVEDLPLASTSGGATNGSGVINLSYLQAGVASSGGVGYGAGPSVGGQRPTNNNFTVDGVDNNNKSVTGPQVFVPNDAVAEFTLLQNQFRAEYGHSSGGQFSTIVRSGTNEYHGRLFDYFQNRKLNAIDQILKNNGATSNPRFDQNRLGITGGGPIIRNKFFFFADFEYSPLGNSSTPGALFAPTAAGYAKAATISTVNQTNLNVLKTYAVAPAATAGAPVVTVAEQNIEIGSLPVIAPNFTNYFYGVASSDYNISDRDQIRGRFIYNRQDGLDTVANLPAFYVPVPVRNYLATLTEYHTFTPSLINELRIGFNRLNQFYPVGPQTFPGLDAFPNLVFNDIGLQLGPNANFPQGSVANLYQGSENLSWTHGRHSFKFGYEFRDYIAVTSFTQRVRGDYQYGKLALFLTDQFPDSVNQRSLGNPLFYGDNLANYFFAQDSWRVTPRLTVDLGLRYERTGIPLGARQQNLNAISTVPGLLDFRSPKMDNTGFGPRVGIAYTLDPAGNTVIRAGFSRATDVINDNLPLNSPPPQFTTNVTLQGVTGSDFLKNGGITSANATVGTLTAAQARAKTAYYLADQTIPYSLNWTLGIEHIIAKDYTLEVRYVGTRGIHELLQQQIDRLNTPVNANRNIPTFLTAPSAATLAALPLTVGQLRPSAANGNATAAGVFVDPQYLAAGFTQPITTYTPQGWSTYHGLSVQMKRRFTNGLLFLAAYTWSHNIDNSTATLNSSTLSQRRVQDFGNVAAEKADSALDRRHRFTFSSVYDLPLFKTSNNWVVKNIVSNWEIAPVYTYESPEYFTVTSGVNGNLNGDSGGIYRTVLNPAGVASTGSDVYGLDRSGNVIRPTNIAGAANVVAWVANNPNARYIKASFGAYANSARNTERTRPINDVDVNLRKRFNFTEKRSFEFSALAFNVFNHPQFIPGSINNAARVSSLGAASYVTVTNVNFNNPEKVFTSNARTVQLVAKLIF
ncbi:MAG: TonB-dependent receptor [Terriglobia bacterium]